MNKKGFTLVELAIVLVIIGLLVGGVLQGQELIKQAQIRNVISSMNSYDTAVNTFRAKYNNALPGDFSKASTFGVDKPGGTGTANLSGTVGSSGNGNGNGVLEDAAGVTSDFDGEIANFWVSLSNVGLIKGSYSQATGCKASGTNCTGLVGTAFPKAPVGVGIVAVSSNGKLYYISGVSASDLDATDGNFSLGTTASATGSNLTQEDAYAVDSKLDDGDALLGSVSAVSRYGNTAYVFTADSSNASNCFTTASGVSSYNTVLKTKKCSLKIRASS